MYLLRLKNDEANIYRGEGLGEDGTVCTISKDKFPGWIALTEYELWTTAVEIHIADEVAKLYAENGNYGLQNSPLYVDTSEWDAKELTDSDTFYGYDFTVVPGQSSKNTSDVQSKLYKGKIKCTFAELYDSDSVNSNFEGTAKKLCSLQKKDFPGFVVKSELGDNPKVWKHYLVEVDESVYDKFPYLEGKNLYVKCDAFDWEEVSGTELDEDEDEAEAHRKQKNSILLGVAAAAALLLLLRK